MIRKGVHIFDDTSSVGLENVGLNETILIKDYDGSGTTKKITITDLTSVDNATTIQDLLDLPNQWDGINSRYNQAPGKMMAPMVDLPLQSSLAMMHGQGSVSFSRSTVGTYIDMYGELTSAAIDEPRFERDGLLIEGDGTNLILNSSDPTTYPLVQMTRGVQLQEHGFNFYRFIPNNGNYGAGTVDGVKIYASTEVAVTDNVYSMSFFAKADEISELRIRRNSVSEGDDASMGNVNLITGEVTLLDTTSGYIRSEYIGNDIWRVHCKFKMNSGKTGIGYYVHAQNQADADGVNGFYLGDAQIEEEYFCTSYIPTGASTVTRTGDVCYMQYKDNAPDNANITFSLDFNILGIKPLSYWQNILSCKNVSGSDNRFYAMVYKTTDKDDAYVDSGTYLGGSRYNFQSSEEALEKIHIAVSGDSSYNNIFASGKFADRHANARTLTLIPTSIQIGGESLNTNANLYGHVSNLKIYNDVFTDNQMIII